jgi:hypothetical protein
MFHAIGPHPLNLTDESKGLSPKVTAASLGGAAATIIWIVLILLNLLPGFLLTAGTGATAALLTALFGYLIPDPLRTATGPVTAAQATAAISAARGTADDDAAHEAYINTATANASQADLAVQNKQVSPKVLGATGGSLLSTIIWIALVLLIPPLKAHLTDPQFTSLVTATGTLLAFVLGYLVSDPLRTTVERN